MRHDSMISTAKSVAGVLGLVVVVISCGRDNAYGHPHPWALRYYGMKGTHVYRTDLAGTVTVRADTTGAYAVTTSAH